ncbi:MAG: hypothetical protein AAFV38_03220 [Pseudomonadota bacterium]
MADLALGFSTYRRDPDYLYGRPELIDQSNLEQINAGFDEVRTLLSKVNQAIPDGAKGTKTVIYCQKDAIYGMGRMYQSLSEVAGGIEVFVEADPQRVLELLELPYATIEAFLDEGQLSDMVLAAP